MVKKRKEGCSYFKCGISVKKQKGKISLNQDLIVNLCLFDDIKDFTQGKNVNCIYMRAAGNNSQYYVSRE